MNREILEHIEETMDPTDVEENYMTSIVYHNHQSIESIEIDQYTPLPIPKRGELLVKVIAFGVNQIDVKFIENNVSNQVLPLPKTLGCEFSGRVLSTSLCYTEYFQVGDNIVGLLPLVWTKRGVAAEFIAVNENLCAKVPRATSIIDAAGIPLAGLTVVQALKEFIQDNNYPRSTVGKRIFIQGAAGSIGTFAIQYCKNVLGMYVIVSSTEKNYTFLKSLGADEIIDHEHIRFEDVIRNCDVILDSKSYQYESRTIHAEDTLLKKPGGRYINICSSDCRGSRNRERKTLTIPDLKLSRLIKTSLRSSIFRFPVYIRRYGCHNFLRLLGKITHISTLENKPIFELFISVRPDGLLLRYIMSLFEQRLIRTIVGRVFTTNNVKDALYYVKSGQARGKVIVMGIQSSRIRKCCIYNDLERDEDLSSPSIFQFDENQKISSGSSLLY